MRDCGSEYNLLHSQGQRLYKSALHGTSRRVSPALLRLNQKGDQSMSLGEVRGTQSSSDTKWNNSSITYWGTTDLQGAQGVQRGYFLNDHGAAGHDRGSFEGSVAIAGRELVVEGKWQYTGGDGEFAGITGNGT